LGAAKSISDNTFASDLERCLPQIGRWPLVDGDILVVCSDGLIDEGIFLAPEDAAAIAYAHPNATAEELTSLLISAADARQRPPSLAEPHGFGDNIACIVMKFSSTKQTRTE
jgi:serine/threonine protein phosphatase PrpC